MSDEEVFGDVRVTPEGYSVAQEAGHPAPRRRSSTDNQSGDGFDEILAQGDFDVATELRLQTERPVTQRRSGDAPPNVRIDVPVNPGEAAVLLVEDDRGLLSWRMPDTAATTESVARHSRRGSESPNVQTFTLSPFPAEVPDARRRGWISDKVTELVLEPVRVAVLRFLVSRTLEVAVRRLEGDMVTGPMWLPRQFAEPWRPGSPEPSISDENPVRILLMIHGTFSSTLGSFGALAETELQQRFYSHYDAIVGYDHKSLSEAPEQNAEAILDMLRGLALPSGSVVDIVAFSRGGLVARILCEALLPESRLPLSVERVVFVGCTNSGTLLAEPENWETLINIYTNLIANAAKIGLAAAGAGAGAPVADYGIKTIGRFVQMLSQIAISERRLPGLAAMEPDGETVELLNARPLSLDRPDYFAITSDFEPPTESGKLLKALALAAADRFSDKLMRQGNDLVVHTASMTSFGQANTATDVAALPPASAVFHTAYFQSDVVQSQIGHFLDVPGLPLPSPAPEAEPRFDPPPAPYIPEPLPDAAPFPDLDDGDDRDAFSPPSPDFGDDGIFGMPSRRGDDYPLQSPAPFPHMPLPFPPPEPSMPDWSPPTPAPRPQARPEAIRRKPPSARRGEASIGRPALTDTTERYIAAEMDPFPKIERRVAVYVTVSPEQIEVAKHAAAGTLGAPVALERKSPLTLIAMATNNCTIEGLSTYEIDLESDEEEIRKFMVRGIAPGAAEVRIEARQGMISGAGGRIVASFLLKPVFVSENQDSERVVQLLTPAPQSAKGEAILRIYEFIDTNKDIILRFDLGIEDPALAVLEDVRLSSNFPLKDYTAGILQALDDAWNLRSDDYQSFLERFLDEARVRTTDLIPRQVRAKLWENRRAISAVHVISEEAYIPWELMCLFNPDPDSDDQDEPRFLAEWGLIRWLHNVPRPRSPVMPRAESSYAIVPEYPNAPKLALAGADVELEMLKSRLQGIHSIEPTSVAVRDFLKQRAQGASLIHFACHGEAAQGPVLTADLLLDRKVVDGRNIDDRLGWQTIKANADFGKGARPLVFVNACQTGKPGRGIAGVAGFADAFLRPHSGRGAAAFIGALWSVDDKLATRFADTVYERLQKGEGLNAAVKAAREIAKGQSDFTWLAYSVYGG